MKTITNIFAATLLLLSLAISAFAYDFSSVCNTGQTLYYNITSSTSPYTVEVTSQNSSSPYYSTYPTGSLTIPSSVTYSGRTYSVTSIGEMALYRCSGLTSVTIPNSVTSIGYYAFYGCSGLTSPVYNANCFAYFPWGYATTYTIPNGIQQIAGEAFLDCSGLTSVTIPNSVTSIGYYAFYGCSGLASITIPNSVTSIGDGAFYDCSGLTTVNFNAINCTTMGSHYYDYVFGGCTSLATLNIGENVTNIPAYAFYGCSGLASITIPNSVTSIGDRAFYDCSGLTTVNFNAINCTTMGSHYYDYVFGGCTSLATLNIGENVTNIPAYAFSGCSGLSSVTIPNSVTSIGDRAFYDCSGLTSVTVGSGVSTIFQNAFSGCSGLTMVVYTGSIAQWCGIRFDNQSAQPLNYAHNLYVNNSLVTNLVIPNTVEEIKAYAFYNANSLTSVTIPNSVTSIGSDAFNGCSGLSGTLTIPNSVTSIGSDAFNGCSGLSGTLTVPNSVASIGNSAFSGCNGLTTLNFNAENCTGTISGSLFDSNNTLSKITIGENVATIPNNAFKNCVALDSIISYASNPPIIYGGTFDSQLSLNTPVVVPCGMVETYEDADFWYNFRRIQQRPDCGATYTITVLSSNNAWGSVSGGGTYMAGETARLIASANGGYRFSNWSDGSTENPHNITVTQNETYIATFVVGSSLPTIYSSFSAEACGSYTWNNQTYTESGEYQQTFAAANSADSVVTLTLTILPAPQPTITIYGELDACNPSSVALVTGQYQSYLWSNGATTIATSVIEPGYYYVEVTGENGCTGISEQTNVGVSNAITEAPQISVVGMNSMNRNVVTWSAMANDNVTAYRIYRENNIANVYEPMATVVASAQTYWTDETADPSSRAYRYKVTAVDECGGESPMSDYHKTMHLTINKGIGNTWNLIWSHYEGFGFGTYRVYRGTSPSNMTMIGEVPSTLNSYTDNTATASTGFYYQVEVVRNTRDAEISSRSNIVTTEENGIEENVTMEIALFPNPVTDILNITSSETISEIEIVNTLGQIVKRIEVNSDNAVCDVEDLTSGVYVVRIRTLRQAQWAVISQRKFVKE